jgi:GNAT superfamily N-acetyltransferase
MAGAVTRPFEEGFPLVGQRFRLNVESPGTAAVVRMEPEERVGELGYEVARGAVTIRSLCIEPPHRGYGAGSEAAWLFLRAAEMAGLGLRAWAPPDLGLAVYFWSRMGFRALHGEGPEGGIWFERRVNR